MLITSLENNKIKKYLKLKDKKYRNQDQLFIAVGEHLVEEAFKLNKLFDLLVLDGFNYKIDFPYTFVTDSIMKKLSDTVTSPKVIGIVKISNNKSILGHRVLLLDDIGDPGNLGTIIRSSVAFNITDIVLSPNSVDLYNEKVIRATEGMIFKINIVRRDLLDTIKELKEKKYLILGTDVRDGIDASNIVSNKYALVIGNEGRGVSSEISKMCDKNINIEMNKECESLNVGVATSIIIYELNR